MRHRFVWALFSILLAATPVGVATSDPGTGKSSPLQLLGSVEIRLGMPEGEALRLLTSQFAVSPITGIAGTYAIKSKEGIGEMLASVAFTNGRVSVISSDWTPSVDDSGAFSEALLSLLSRLAPQPSQGKRKSVESCSVTFADGLTAGTDTQLRMAEVICGRQRVSITVSRTNGGRSVAQLQLVTM